MEKSNLISKAKQLDLQMYVPGDESDMLFVKLWMQLKITGDLYKAIHPEARTPSAMLNHFQTPNLALYTLNSKGDIDFLFWVKPASDVAEERTAIVGGWVAEDIRGTRKAVLLANAAYQMVFLKYDYCLGTTWQRELFDTLKGIGYDIISYVPSLYGIKDVYFILLKKQDFQDSHLRKLATRIERNMK